ncbi:MAG: hypothetical protein ACJ8EL_19080 [Rhizomicrobium sp.]
MARGGDGRRHGGDQRRGHERDEVHGGRASAQPRGRRPRHGGDDLRDRADRGEAATVGATAATSVMVVNATTITAEGHQPGLGTTAVTISDTKQTGGDGGDDRCHDRDRRRGGEVQDDHGGDAHVVVTTADGTGILTDGFTL